MIHLDRFGWRFEGSECWALREVSLQIARGEFVAIAGTSGSGKTSLALAACGLLVGRHAGDTEGSIRIADHDVLTTPLHQVSESIALVQQNPEAHFATLTVDDEVAFGLENRGLPVDEILARRAEAMELLSITHLAGRTLATLSGGEQQRVAVASVVAGHPEALILDEPTASLDPQASRDLFHTLAALCREKKLTVVIVEHKLAHLLPLKPRLVVLEDGRVVTDVRDSVSTACPSYLADPDPGRLGDDLSTRVETTAQPLVEVSDMTVELGGSTILRDIDLTIRPGEVVALLGPNGGGKSTLLHCLMGLVQPVRGTIRVCDVDVTPTVVSRLAQRVGVVFQNADHQLVADTVWNELLFAVRNLKPPGTAEEPEAARLLKTAGLAARSEDHPYRLSWGQKRRLNLISAILHHPRLLLMDEPFAGQDSRNVSLMLDTIGGKLQDAMNGDKDTGHARWGAGLLVTHDPRVVVRACTRVLFIAGGRIIINAPVHAAFEQLRKMGFGAYAPSVSNPTADETASG